MTYFLLFSERLVLSFYFFQFWYFLFLAVYPMNFSKMPGISGTKITLSVYPQKQWTFWKIPGTSGTNNHTFFLIYPRKQWTFWKIPRTSGTNNHTFLLIYPQKQWPFSKIPGISGTNNHTRSLPSEAMNFLENTRHFRNQWSYFFC